MVIFKDSDLSPTGNRPYSKVIRGQSSSRRKVLLSPLKDFTPPAPVIEGSLVFDEPLVSPSITPIQAPAQQLPHFDQEKSRIEADLSSHRQRAFQQVDAELAHRRAQFQSQLDADYAAKIQAGYEEGLRRGHQETQAQLSQHAADLKDIFRELKGQSHGLEESAKSDIIAIAIHAAERMITTQLTLSPEIIRGIVDDAMRRITDKNKVIIRVNPHDSMWLKDHRDWLDHYSQDVHEMIIQEDDKVEQGGCIIETKLGYIDSSIKSKIASIESALMAAFEEEQHQGNSHGNSSIVADDDNDDDDFDEDESPEDDYSDEDDDKDDHDPDDESEDEEDFGTSSFGDAEEDSEDDYSFDGL
jgi:flagellar assembly protein FliH